jgi:hypothetical protein
MSEIYLAETLDGGAIRLVETWESVSSPLPSDAKGRRWDVREPAQIDTLVLHQTAVPGGFGVSARHRAAVPRLDDSESSWMLRARMARYRNTPYTCVYSPQDQASVIQWPFWAYLYHGHRANAYSIGWAYDGRLPGDEIDADGAQESLRHVIEWARGFGCPLRFVEGHRQHAAARGGDPGSEIWSQVALPVAREFGLAPNDRVTGTGRRIPDSWR